MAKFFEKLETDQYEKELSNPREESVDSDFLIKTLSAIKNGVEESDKVSEKTQQDLIDKIEQLGLQFHKTGQVDARALTRLLDSIQAEKDLDGKRSIRVKDEKAVLYSLKQFQANALTSSITDDINQALNDYAQNNNLKNSKEFESFNAGQLSIDGFLSQVQENHSLDVSSIREEVANYTSQTSLITRAMQAQFKEQLTQLSTSSRMEFDTLTQSFVNGKTTQDQFLSDISELLQTVESDKAILNNGLDNLSQDLRVIQSNTDPDNNQLSNAEKIVNSNRLELEAENNELLSKALGNITTNERSDVKKSVLSGARSAEDLGSAAADGLLDLVADMTGLDFLHSDSDSLVDSIFNRGDKSDKDGKRGRDSKRSKGTRSRGRKGGRGILGAAKNLIGGGSKALGSLGKVASVGLKAAAPVAAIASTGMAAFDYFSAEDSAERQKALGSGVGGLIGGALGAIGGPLGIAAGAALGNWVGGELASFFSDPEDSIPDSIKEGGAVEELRFIDQGLMPKVMQEAEKPDGDYDLDDIESLREYRKELMDDKVPEYFERVLKVNGLDDASDAKKLGLIKTKLEALKNSNPDLYKEVINKAMSLYPNSGEKPSQELTGIASVADTAQTSELDVQDKQDPEVAKKIKHYTDQGMTDPNRIALATGLHPNEVRKSLNGGSDTFRTPVGEYKSKSDQSQGSNSKNAQSGSQVVIQNSGSQTESDPFRLSDMSLSIMTHIM